MASLPAETVQALLSAEAGIGNIINSNDPVATLSDMGQTLAAVADLAGNPLGVLATNGLALQVTLAKMQLDAQEGRPISTSDILSIVGNIVTMAAAGAVILTPAGRAASIFAKVALGIGAAQILGPLAIPDAAAAGNVAAKAALPPRSDPLTLDLDGDGLETTGTGSLNPIYFDHDGDGIKTSSGWVRPDDAFLVLDKDGNGTIDNGSELFGDSTIKSNGQTATDGFDALADLDSNADGVVNTNDTQFSNLRIWRDLNQDGMSQINELLTLGSQNITGINVAKTINSETLPNGNQIADKGTFIKSDGTTGELDAITGNLADINLADDTFHRQFTDILDTSSVTSLPNMQGSGKVRDLREAATLSITLQSLLTNYGVATTRAEQTAQLDQLLDAWADTGGMAESLTQRVAEMTGYTKADGTVIPYTLNSNLSAEWVQKLHIVETFNGSYFYGLPGTEQTQGAITGLTIATPNASSTSVQITINFNQQQLGLLQQSYDAIKSSVYDALLLQTRFKSLIDQINLVTDANGITLDFTQVQTYFEAKIIENAVLGITDLIDFNRSTSSILEGSGWQGYELLESKLSDPALLTAFAESNVIFTSGNGTSGSDILALDNSSTSINAFAGNDIVYAGGGNNYINGGADDDVLYGQDGNDNIRGDIGNDILNGGTGNDLLNGGIGNDIYLFGIGDGQDVINNDSNLGIGVIESDLIKLGAGITTSNVKLSRSNNSLIIEIANSADKLTVENYFNTESITNSAVKTVRFADGTTWGVADVMAKVQVATIGDDVIYGYAANDNLNGGDGNDTLIGGGGDDVLEGGTGTDFIDAGTGDDSLSGSAGSDSLYGGAGNDVLEGGSENDTLSGHTGNDTLNGGSQNDTLYGDAGNDSLNGGSEDDALYGGADDDNLQGGDGNDSLYGDAGNDTLNGGLGNDLLNGGAGTNIYLFARGDGQDTIDNSTAGRTDTLSLAAGILTTDVTLVRVVDDLEIRINNSTDKVIVKNHFTTSPINQLLFNNGTSWNQSTFDTQLNTSATSGSDEIRGRSLADNISGLAGFDSIYGYGGNDTLSGGDNSDILYGGADNDALNGDADTDTLYGEEGEDTLNGGTSNDILIGGNGNDTYIYNLGGSIGTGVDTIEEVADASNSYDKVNFGAGITTSNTTYYKIGNDLQFRFNSYDYLTIKNFFLTTDNQYKVEQFVFTDGTVWTSQNIQALLTTPTSSNDRISGYDFADNINGLEGSDQLYGNDGNDTLIGAQGNDYLNGGTGNDLLEGGVDNDTLVGEVGDDVYKYQRGDGFDTIIDTSGNDFLLLDAGILPADVSLLRDGSNLFLVLNNSEISMQLTNDQIETIQFQNGTIWNLATIQANTVFGTVNTFTGTAANDNYTVDNNNDVINEAANQGTDSVTSSVSYALGANVENLTLTGILNLTASGNSLDNVITGNGGSNLLNGGGYFTGYSNDGADTLIGGAGDDIYFVTPSEGDVVTELAGGGNDTVYSAANYTLAANVENLIMVGAYQFALTATGNVLNNYIRARSNAYGDIIDGGAGADTMTGGYDTTFYVDNIGDVVGGSGNYKVYSSVDYTLAAHLDGVYFNNITETLILTGTNAIKATGNAGNNALDGRQNSAINILEGGAGDDIYYAGANDIVIEQVGGGNDTLSIYADQFTTYLFKASNNIENLVVSTANTNAVNLEGSEDNNNLQGNNGVNNIKGLGGNDTIYGGTNGGDTLDGGDGNDSIGGSGWLYGGAGDDALGATYGSVFTGGTGNDTMGGNAVDTFVYVRGDGSDTIRDYTSVLNQTSDFRDKISFGAGVTVDDILLSRIGDNLIISVAGTSDTIIVEQHFVPDVGTLSRSVELLQFENGATWDMAEILIRASNTNSPISENTDYVIGTSNNDLIKTLGGNDYVIAGDGDDTIEGGAGNDTLLGKSGIDVLAGGLGDDTLQGGFGGDTYKFGRGAGNDLIIDAKNNLEVDSILLDTDIDPAQITVRRSSVNYYDLTLSIVGDAAQITIQNFYAFGQENSKQVVFANGTVWNDSQLRDLATSYFGTSADDIVTGTDTGSDKLFGLEGKDTLNGLAGDDTLDGGLGADTMVGGFGGDTYVVDNIGDVIVEDNDGYIDTVESTISYTLSANVDNLTLTGSGDINATGNADSNVLTGNSGNNQLDGGAGLDNLTGGLGDDVYLIDSGNDVVTENAGEGLDSVQSTVTYTLLSNVENLTLAGTSAINGTGNAENNILIGNGAVNRLTGADGHDTLEGGTGNDTMVGGLGDDTYIIDVATDVITEATNAGTDTVISAITYTLGSTSNLENLYLTGTANVNATGNALNNEISGNSGNNVITAGAGNDTLEGGLGIDTLVGGLASDDYYYYLGYGNDQIDNTATDNATAVDTLYMIDILPANVVLSRVGSDLVLTINAAETVTVKNYFAAGDSKIDQIIFGDETVWNQADIQLLVPSVPTTGDDTLTGTSADDIIDALAGNDTVSGGDGNDQLLGNTGNDSLNGGNGNDILNGGTGTDTMIGGLGDDTYTVDVSTDVVTEAASAGTDAINVAITTVSGTYTLGANVENGTLINTVAFTLTGNTLNNVLTGNAAANTLNGGDGNDTLSGLAGNDTMVGGLGNDTYTIDVTTDVVTEAASAGTDTVNVAVTSAGGTYTVATNVENATLVNTVAYNLTGNTSNNVLTGNAAANIINGGTGNDTMIGGLGNDTYTINVTTDVITENLNEGTDLVNVLVTTAGGTYTLAANLENATLTNTVAYSLTGNTLDNVLTGNGAANTLNGGDGNDTLDGLVGNDTMVGGLGNDTYTIGATGDVVTEAASAGTDTVNVAIATASGTYTVAANVENAILTNTVAYNLTGNALANFLKGNAANNTLTDTAGGNDLLQGLAGIDTFNDTVGNNLFDGGTGNDTMTGGAGRDIFIGGTGNDTITTGTGFDVISFNKGDGADIINASTGADNTISLGGNFAYSDLSLTKSTNDLILKMGASDQITLKNWYLSSPTNKSVINLQVVAEAIQGFTLGGADALRNNKIENFNFTNLVAAFDTAGATANWQLTDARLTTHLLAGSDTTAIGGDLAYQYGKNSNLTGMGSLNAQSVITAASFGQTAQTLNNPTVWQAELVKMG